MFTLTWDCGSPRLLVNPASVARSAALAACIRLGLAMDEAQDCAQSFVVQLFEGHTLVADALQDGDKLRAWLQRCAHNWVISWLRRRNTRVRHEVDFGEVAYTLASSPHEEAPVLRADLKRLLDSALAHLTPDQRALYHLRYVREMDVHEIAAFEDRSCPAVSSALLRLNRSLRRELTLLGFTEEAASDFLHDLADD